MRADVANDFRNSSNAFCKLVWPIARSLAGGGTLKAVEDVTAKDFQKDLDVLAGIDGWQVLYENGVIRGIASRVQNTGKSYDTFTIRFSRNTGTETEFNKRLKAIQQKEQGWLYPHLTLQAYTEVDYSELLSFAIVKTEPLYLYALESYRQNFSAGKCYMQVNKQDGNKFIVVPWQNLQRDNISPAIWHKTETNLQQTKLWGF